MAVWPARLIMSDQVSKCTLNKLDRVGISVVAPLYDNVYLGSGGIHCSTGPLVHDPVWSPSPSRGNTHG